MKVLYVYKDYYPVVGGIENHIRLICRGLKASWPEVEPTVLVTNRARNTVIEEIDGVRVIKAGRLATVSSAPISLSLFAWIRRLEADITHLHFPYPIGELAYLLGGRSHGMAAIATASRVSGTPPRVVGGVGETAPRREAMAATTPRHQAMVITYHSDIVRQKYLLQVYRPFLYRLLARADRITVSSPNYIQSSPYLRPLADKCVVIPHGANLNRFVATPEVQRRAQELRQRYASPLVLFVGLLRYYKGLSYLIEAMAEMARTTSAWERGVAEGEQGRSARLLVVGEGPQGQEWRELSRKLGLEEKVIFLGRVSDEELVALYHACDVFVLPAIHRSESWGAVQVEAMACGKPVVCTELGTGTSFVNLDGQTGLVVPPRDAGALAQAIGTLLQDQSLRQQMGQRARQRAEKEFSSTTMVKRLVDLYKDVLSIGTPSRVSAIATASRVLGGTAPRVSGGVGGT
jgi:glycosyltransferase involved in cell wall biosynthesis